MKPRYKITVERRGSVHYSATVRADNGEILSSLHWNPTHDGAVADAKAWLLNHLAEVSVVPTEDSV